MQVAQGFFDEEDDAEGDSWEEIEFGECRRLDFANKSISRLQ